MAVPLTLRGLFSAGLAISDALREFRGAEDLCRDLLDGSAHIELLAADTLYAGLFESVAAGDSLDGALARLAIEPETEPGRPHLRSRRIAQPGSAGSIAGQDEAVMRPESVRRQNASPQKPAAQRHPAAVIQPTSLETQRPALVTERRDIDGPDRIAAAELPRGGRSARVAEPVLAGRAAVGPDTASALAMSKTSAAHELSDRAERAGLLNVWIRAAQSPIAAPALSDDAAADDGILTAPLAAAVDAITRRSLTPVEIASPHVIQPAGSLHAIVHDSASLPERPADTPLRRLAAMGGMRATRLDAAQTADSESRTSPSTSRGLPGPSSRSVERQAAGVATASAPDTSASADDREFADRLAAVIRHEAIRHGIDPLEYES